MKLLSSSSSKACEYRGERGLVDRPRPGDPLRAVDEAMRAGVAGDSTGGAVEETSLGHPYLRIRISDQVLACATRGQ